MRHRFIVTSLAVLAILVMGCAVRTDSNPNVSLEDTYWKLTRLGDQTVSVVDGQRELHLVLRGKTGRLSGFGGCNTLAGGYSKNATLLTLGPVASTRMACATGMESETYFLSALERVHAWKIAGSRLELFDAKRVFVASIEARALK